MEDQPPAVPGYAVGRCLGSGGTGEVYLARDLASGREVALKRLRGSGDPAGRDRLRREAAILAALEHPHLPRVHDVLETPAGVVLVLQHAAGGSLADLLAGRGALAPGEVVTIGTPLAEALSAAHERGVVHGDVSPGNVLFTAEGRPLLADLGVARILGERGIVPGLTPGFADPAVLAGSVPTPAGDVYGLAAVCRAALGPAGGDPGAGPSAATGLLSVLDIALSADPALRPPAARLAVMLYDSCPPQPVRLVPPPTGPQGARPPDLATVERVVASPSEACPDSGVSRRGLRRPAAAVAAAVVVLALGAAGALAMRSGPTASVVSPALSPAADWDAVLHDLDSRRATAFAAADPSGLAAVYAPGSRALADDTRLVASLQARGLRARDLRHDLVAVRPAESLPDRVVLRVVDRIPPYELVDAGGAVRERSPGRGERTWLVTLVPGSGGWRVADVEAA